jgi:predicted RNA methylase
MANNDTIKTLLKDLTNSFSFANLERFIREKNRHCIKLPTPHPRDLKTAIGVCDPDFTIHSEWLLIANGLNESEKSLTSTPFVILVVKVDGELSARSCRKRQFDYATKWLGWCGTGNAVDIYAKLDEKVKGVIRQGFFVFHDDSGNFRFSLVVAPIGKNDKPNYRRQTFFVEKGKKNTTFHQRMEMPWNSLEGIKKAFSVEALTKEFYEKLFAWYERARKDKDIEFPNDVNTDDDNQSRKSEHLIRLITRLMFVWFIKQKHLVPEKLFDKEELKGILKTFSPSRDDNYYRAILQNLFFATLNSEITNRGFATEGKTREENKEHFDIKTLYRYKDEFALTEKKAIELFQTIPFLNGGLFECLDRGIDYSDGFSREPKWRAHIPNKYFFDEKEDKLGLIPLLSRYNFTVDENAPGDEEVALDPELLGKVFENLLGAFNPETQDAARKATGSFYTPREIVKYMVDESLIAHLTTKCGEEHSATIRKLFTDGEHPADKILCDKMDDALVKAKILDPACGSGAFPMGILLRMVELLRILRNTPDEESSYDLKLNLIENCIYGDDIQCIAVQISKLRFFISLVCEQTPTNDPEKNYGINPLPNLETKFVAADSLIVLDKPKKRDATGQFQPEMFSDEEDKEIIALKNDLWDVRHKHFCARTYKEKKALRQEDQRLRKKLAETLQEKEGYEVDAAKNMASWDPYDQNTSAKFSDPEWMFNVKDGFDIIIGNPPYGAEFSEEHKKLLKKRFAHIVERIRNSFLYFMGASFDIIKPNGIVCFILPNEFLFQIYMTKARRFFLDKARFMFAINVGEDVFDAIVPTCIIALQKYQSAFYELPIADLRDCSLEELPERLSTPAFQRTSNESIRSAPNSIFSFDIGSANLVNRLSSQFKPFERFCDDVANGISTSCDGVYIVPEEKVAQERFEEPFCKPCIRGGQFNRYFCPKDTGDRILYVTSEFDAKKGKRVLEYLASHKSLLIRKSVEKKAGNREWHVLFRARYEDLFRKPKVIVRQTGDGIIAAVDDEAGFYCIDSVNVALVKKQFFTKIYFLTGLLNSRLLNFFYREISQEAGRVLAQVKPLRIRMLPIAEAKQEVESAITKSVMQIMHAKAKKADADTSSLEGDIDNLVYDLYKLTDPEKEIVRQSCKKPKKVSGKGKKAVIAEPKDVAKAVEAEEDDGEDAMD